MLIKLLLFLMWFFGGGGGGGVCQCFYFLFFYYYYCFMFFFFFLLFFLLFFLYFVFFFCDRLGNSHLTWGLFSYIAFYINPRRYIVKKITVVKYLKNNLTLHFLARNVGIILTKIPIFHQVK